MLTRHARASVPRRPGGQETCIILPQLKIAFDIGRCPQRACHMVLPLCRRCGGGLDVAPSAAPPRCASRTNHRILSATYYLSALQETVCFSHTHMDHVGGAVRLPPCLCSLCPPLACLPADRPLLGAKAMATNIHPPACAPPPWITGLPRLDAGDAWPHAAHAALPRAHGRPYRGKHTPPDAHLTTALPQYRNTLLHMQTLRIRLSFAPQRYFSALRELDGSDLAYKAVPIIPGEEHPMPGGRHVIRPFKTIHPVPSQGYCVFSRKSKLKAEYSGLPVRARMHRTHRSRPMDAAAPLSPAANAAASL